VQTLEDRDAIRALLVAYATTLDNRDFAGFEQLWAKDAEFFGGAGNTENWAAVTFAAVPVPSGERTDARRAHAFDIG
jgi:SnoaL-like domain